MTRTLILDGKDVNSRNIYGETPLLWASNIGDASLVTRLVSLGVDVNQQNEITGETPLIVAARNGHVVVVDILIKNKARFDIKDRTGCDANDAAVAAGHPDVLSILCKAGSSIDPTKTGQYLVSAAKAGDITTVENMLQLGASVNHQVPDGESGLMAAVKSDNVHILNTLLKRGAKVDLTDSWGRSALLFAAQSGRWEVCEILILAGADLNKRDARGNTPLMWALLMGHQDVVLKLVQDGADVSVKNMANQNALYLAAFSPDVARTLLQINARIVETIVQNDDYHRTALAYHWLGSFIEDEISAGILEMGIGAGEAKIAYDIAARFFESTANQLNEAASELRTKHGTRIAAAILHNVLSVYQAKASARQQAQQVAELGSLRSLASGGTGQSVGSGGATYLVIWPGKSLLETADQYDSIADELRKLSQSCKAKVDCYRNVIPGQELNCFNK